LIGRGILICCVGNNRIDHDEFVGVVKSRTFYGSAEVMNDLYGKEINGIFLAISKLGEAFCGVEGEDFEIY